MAAPAPDVSPSIPVRQPPPDFRSVVVEAVEELTPWMVRVTLAGPGLAGFGSGDDLPAASVRLLLPSPGDGELEIPTWAGNEFLRADGSRPVIRTLTPLRIDRGDGRLDVEVVVHDRSPLSEWATAAQPGDAVAVSGPGRGYAASPAATHHLLAGDESALPAITELLDALAPAPVTALVEVARPDARQALPERPGVDVRWLDAIAGAPQGEALVDAVTATPVDPDTAVWVAGEAAAVQRIRRHLFTERGIPRSQATVRGYWKHGRAS